MRNRLLTLVISAALLLSAGAVRAQDGLSPDELALLGRINRAMQGINTYASYVSEVTSHETYHMTMYVSGSMLEFVHDATIKKQVEVVAGNIRASFAMTVRDTSSVADPVVYTLTAEARVIDGVMLVRADRAPVEGEAALPTDLAPLPDGWTRIENLDDWPALGGLGLDSLLDGTEQFDLMADLDLLAAIDPVITVETVNWGQSTADVITVTIPAQNLLAAGSDAFDLQAVIGPASAVITDASRVVFSVTIGADGQPLRRRITVVMGAEGVDASAQSADLPPGSTYDVVIENTETGKFRDFNAPLEPVTVPPL
jgi:hypothetical protein